MGDFNVHHIEWLHSNTTDVGGREAFDFSISHELEQIIQHPTRVPDRHSDRVNILYLFFKSNPQNYTYTILPPLQTSNHTIVNSAEHSFPYDHLILKPPLGTRPPRPRQSRTQLVFTDSLVIILN